VARSEEGGPPVTPSLLDRLIDTEPRVSRDRELSRSQTVEDFRLGVLRDLDWLLNSRRVMDPAGNSHPELRDSVFNFGLPDLTSMSADDPNTRKALLGAVQETLRVFEPRLEATRVTLVAAPDEDHRSLRFVIEGLLKLDPSPVRVSFDTVLEIGSGQFRINEGGGSA